MHEIIFYQKSNGETPVLDYMKSLRDSDSKDSRIKHNKIAQYIKVFGGERNASGKAFCGPPGRRNMGAETEQR